jgi:uncharacterized double-CXXCG motif protein
LPGVKCDECGATWASTGTAYPSVDLSNIPDVRAFTEGWPVSIVELAQLCELVKDFVPANVDLPPGTELGPLEGNAWGKFGDFAWSNPWTPLVSARVIRLLVTQDIRMPTSVSTRIRYRAKTAPELLELEIIPQAELAPAAFEDGTLSLCHGCGRPQSRVREIIVGASSVPNDLDLFRVRRFSQIILTTERFKRAVEEARLTDIRFVDVCVA